MRTHQLENDPCVVIKLDIEPLINTPKIVPNGVPTPPLNRVPPMTDAEMASISSPLACSTKPEQLFRQNRNPPHPAKSPFMPDAGNFPVLCLLRHCSTYHQDHRLRPCGQDLPLQLGRLPQDRRWHDDPRRGGADRGPEGPGCRRGGLGLLYRCDPADRGVQRGNSAGAQGTLYQDAAAEAPQSGKWVNNKKDPPTGLPEDLLFSG